MYRGFDVDVNFLLMFEASIGQGHFTYKLDCNVISGLDICTYEQTWRGEFECLIEAVRGGSVRHATRLRVLTLVNLSESSTSTLFNEFEFATDS